VIGLTLRHDTLRTTTGYLTGGPLLAAAAPVDSRW
jgi:hypothetical protein